MPISTKKIGSTITLQIKYISLSIHPLLHFFLVPLCSASSLLTCAERTNQGRNCFFIAGQQTDRNTYYFGGLLAVGFNRGEDSFLSVDRQDGAKQPGANTNSLIEDKKRRSAFKNGTILNCPYRLHSFPFSSSFKMKVKIGPMIE